MRDWPATLSNVTASGETAILLTVAAVRGSTPREVGAKMIVTGKETIGTIGGGQLEYQCVRSAAEWIRSPSAARPGARRFVLGANCGQCCGGVADVLFERVDGSSGTDWLRTLTAHWQSRQPAVLATHLEEPETKIVITANDDGYAGIAGMTDAAREMLDNGSSATVHGDFLLEPVTETAVPVAVFGAGHVGTAMVDVLSRLDTNVRWVDDRRGMFPARVPEGVVPVNAPDPAREALAMPPGSYYLVMTHSHPLDLDLCAAILGRRDAAYCGLIGSRSKRRRFEKKLVALGLSRADLDGLTCPIGVAGIESRHPADIALAAAAEVIQVRDALRRREAAPRLEVAG